MLDRSEQSDSRRSYRVILWESYLNMEDTTFEGRPDGSSEVSVPGVQRRGEGACADADQRNVAFLQLLHHGVMTHILECWLVDDPVGSHHVAHCLIQVDELPQVALRQ